MPYDAARHGPRRIVGPGFHDQVHEVVHRVPAGMVASYGDVARALGSVNVARHVGWALAALPPGSDVPWWRIVDSKGRLARPGTAAARRQMKLLLAEGVRVERDRIVEFRAVRVPAL
ncbi:MAG: MGMT family protein [bacterium]|nr:MGMT family protein [bacterium]